jgi:hypothetical protein
MVVAVLDGYEQGRQLLEEYQLNAQLGIPEAPARQFLGDIGVPGVPTLLALDESGVVQHRLMGAMTPTQAAQWVAREMEQAR